MVETTTTFKLQYKYTIAYLSQNTFEAIHVNVQKSIIAPYSETYTK